MHPFPAREAVAPALAAVVEAVRRLEAEEGPEVAAVEPAVAPYSS